MGRNRLPDNIKKARGTLQKCRMENTVGLELVEEVKAPTWLTNDAKKIFREKANMLIAYRVLSSLDIDQLAIYSAKMAEIKECQKQIDESGKFSTVYNDEGNIVAFLPNPYIKLQQDAIKVVTAIAPKFGFSPADRKALAAPEKDDRDEFTDFEEI